MVKKIIKTMKLNISADKIFFSRKRNKSQHAKLQLSVLATEARTGIDENNQLTNSIVILKRLVKNNKQILNNLISNKKISKKEVEKNLNNEKQELILLNKNLKGERNFIKLKYIKTKNEIEQVLSNLKTELDIIVNRKFIIENALKEKESIIKKIKYDLKTLCKPPFPLIKEEERDNYISINEAEEIFSDYLEMIQVELMVQCKTFNRFQNKYISLLENKNKLLDTIIDIKKSKNIDKKNNLEIIYDYINKIGDEDSLLNESIASVYEEDYNDIRFPIKIDNICRIDKKSFEKKFFNIPKLSLSQIIYNKKRIKPEDAEKSLSRIILNQPTSKDLEIKKMKDNIKKIKKKIKSNELKCKQFNEKIKKMEKIIENYNLVNEGNNILKLKDELTTK